MNRSLTLAAFALFAFAPACILVISDDGLDLHSGDHWETPMRAETRTLEAFHAVALHTSADVTVRIGADQTVLVTAPESLVSFVRTEVVDGVLTIDRAPGAPSARQRVQVQINVLALDAASLSGSGDLSVSGLACPAFKGSLSGSGDLVLSGAVETLELDLDGSGDINAYGLAARSGTVRLTGSGDIQVNASERLDLSLVGSGDIRYRGAAQVTQKLNGSGDITRQ